MVSIRSKGPRTPGWQYPLMLSGIILISIACWVHRIEFYPLTAWHLYANRDTSGKVSYYKVLGRHESGATSPVRLEDAIGALALDARYNPVLDKCFGDPARVAVCEKFLTASGAAYNARRQPGTRLTHYEIQTWTWDFLTSPHDPHQGRLLNQFIVDVRNGKATPAVVEPSSAPR